MIADFKDRADAGRQLAAAVVHLGLVDPLVLALPRGGVPVAAEVASALRAPLDLLIVRKIGAPGQPELAVAAIAEGDPPTVVIDESTSRVTDTDHAYIKCAARTQRCEIKRRCQAYRRGCARLDVAGKTVVVVDDGIATGTTVRAALKALRRLRPAKLVLAVPVASNDTIYELSKLVDDVVCLSQPGHFGSVGTYYADFHQVGDEEVIALLDAGRIRYEAETATRALHGGEHPMVPSSEGNPSIDPREFLRGSWPRAEGSWPVPYAVADHGPDCAASRRTLASRARIGGWSLSTTRLTSKPSCTICSRRSPQRTATSRCAASRRICRGFCWGASGF